MMDLQLDYERLRARAGHLLHRLNEQKKQIDCLEGNHHLLSKQLVFLNQNSVFRKLVPERIPSGMKHDRFVTHSSGLDWLSWSLRLSLLSFTAGVVVLFIFLNAG